MIHKINQNCVDSVFAVGKMRWFSTVTALRHCGQLIKVSGHHKIIKETRLIQSGFCQICGSAHFRGIGVQQHGTKVVETKPVSARKCFSSQSTVETQDQELKFTPVYRFRYIVPFHVLCRAKLYQTGIVFCAVPVTHFLHTQGLLTSTFMYSLSGIASLAAVMLYIMGEFFRRIIGILSVDESMAVVRISHLTFWGNRRDVIVSAKDIVPILDLSENLEEVFVMLKFYNSDKSYFLFHNHGIIDEDKFWRILN